MQIVGVAFKDGGRVYDFRVGDIEMEIGMPLIVQTAQGEAYGTVAVLPRKPKADEISATAPVLRLATPEDEAHQRSLREKKQTAFEICERKIAEKKLDMVLIDVEIGFGDGKVILFFTAESRVDFRELVKELAGALRARIEMRQIGARDEAKRTGGIGSCGRVLCCSSFLSDFVPVSIKMAKDQGLSLSPTKISGLCGRLMCCLNYEQKTYEGMRKQMPRVDRAVTTPDGPGTVVELHVLSGLVKVKRHAEDGSYSFGVYPVESLTWNREAPRPPKEGASDGQPQRRWKDGPPAQVEHGKNKEKTQSEANPTLQQPLPAQENVLADNENPGEIHNEK